MTRHTLNRRELEDLHSLLRRAAERAEKAKRVDDAEKLAKEVLELEIELARLP